MERVNNININAWETVDDLQIKGFRIIQDTRGFKYGTDAVLLANFANVAKGDNVVDFCTGGGIIPLLLAAKTEAKYIAGIEIQHDIANVAQRSVILNNISDRVEIFEGDIKNALNLLNKQKFDVITCNPPYMTGGGGLINSEDMKAVSRHEILCTLDDVFYSASRVLRYGGRIFMVHKAERLADLIEISRKYKLEPKKIRLVYPCEGKNANLVLFSAMLGGGVQIDCLPPLFLNA